MMENIVAQFNADLFHIAYAFTSNDECRYDINGVSIEPHTEKGVLMVATDGHRLIIIHDVDGFVKENIIVRMDKNPLSLCQKKSADKIRWTEEFNKREVEVLADGTAFVCLSGKRIGIQKDAIIDSTFPDWHEVLPKGVHKQPTIAGYNGRYLGSFSAAAKRLTGREEIIFAAREIEPFIINFVGTGNAFGVMMPMRIDDNFVGVPSFIKEATVHKAGAA